MPARKKPNSPDQTEQEVGQTSAKKSIPLGTDPAVTFCSAEGRAVVMTYWDLWFALVAVRDCDGSLDRLWDRLGEQLKPYSSDRDRIERKWSHLRDLENRLTNAGLTVHEVVDAAGDRTRYEVMRARSRVLEHSERQHERSTAMLYTLRQRRTDHALRGYWDRFPVSPQPFEDEIRAKFERKGIYSDRESYGLADELDRYVSRAEMVLKSGQVAEAQARLRGWMTAVIELINSVDDSSNSVGMSFGEAFGAYLKIPIEPTGIDPGVFFPDLLDFLIWEDYGLTDEEIDGYFGTLTPTQAHLCSEHLRHRIEELERDALGYHNQKALTILGRIVAG